MVENLKRCHRCHQSLPVSAFGRDRNRVGGLDHYCCGCRRSMNRADYLKHAERRKAATYTYWQEGKLPSFQKLTPTELVEAREADESQVRVSIYRAMLSALTVDDGCQIDLAEGENKRNIQSTVYQFARAMGIKVHFDRMPADSRVLRFEVLAIKEGGKKRHG